jgi:hypothetical protein
LRPSAELPDCVAAVADGLSRSVAIALRREAIREVVGYRYFHL